MLIWSITCSVKSDKSEQSGVPSPLFKAAAMIIKEYRIVLPIALEEYEKAHAWTTAKITQQDTRDTGDQLHIVRNEHFDGFPDDAGPQGYRHKGPEGNVHTDRGQFTHKVFYYKSKVPRWAKILAPKELLVFHEKTWEAFPYSRTEFSNPDFLKDRLYLRLDSLCISDRGTSENVHCLSAEQLAQREVVYLDISDDHYTSKDLREDEDPRTFRSLTTGRGSLQGAWQSTASPVMCCYKLLIMDFKWMGLQGKVEQYAAETEKKMFTSFYRKMFCWIDHWYGLALDEALKFERTVYQECEDGYQYLTAPGRTRSTQSSGLLNPSLFHHRSSKHKHRESSSKLQMTGSKIDHTAADSSGVHDRKKSLADVPSRDH